MLNQHPQEKIVETFGYNGITVEIVEWTDTIWCGKIEYAENNVDEPNVEKMSDDYFSLTSRARPVDTLEGDWSVCISANYLSRERPNGVKYGDDKLPIYEYYGFYNPEKNAHEFGYLYVPVDKRD